MHLGKIILTSRLKEERERLCLPQKQLIEGCGVTKQTVIRWEAGASIPSDKLAKLAELGFDVLYVVTGIRAGTLPDTAPPLTMANLSREEEVLLDNFRHSSAKARAAIKATSDALAQRDIGKGKVG